MHKSYLTRATVLFTLPEMHIGYSCQLVTPAEYSGVLVTPQTCVYFSLKNHPQSEFRDEFTKTRMTGLSDGEKDLGILHVA